MNIRITKLHPNAIVPAYGTPDSACFDLSILEDAVIPAHSAAFLRTGLVFGVPKGHVMFIFARSSLYKKYGLQLANQVGVLDADFCGPEDECKLYLRNPGDTDVALTEGLRLAQGMVLPFPSVTFEEGPPLGPSRGGWGSTGA